jgi:hypothetical protein
MKPSIDAAKMIAIFEITIDYLLSESRERNTSKDTNLFKRLNDISVLPFKV